MLRFEKIYDDENEHFKYVILVDNNNIGECHIYKEYDFDLNIDNDYIFDIRLLKIFDETDRNKKYGSLLFEYALNNILTDYPDAIFILNACPIENKSENNLLKLIKLYSLYGFNIYKKEHLNCLMIKYF